MICTVRQVQGAAEITPTFRKISVGSPKQIEGCDPLGYVGYITTFSVVAMPWSGEHRGFELEAFLKNGGSVTATQRAFRTRFSLRHAVVG
jgi:hypothetical protein